VVTYWPTPYTFTYQYPTHSQKTKIMISLDTAAPFDGVVHAPITSTTMRQPRGECVSTGIVGPSLCSWRFLIVPVEILDVIVKDALWILPQSDLIPISLVNQLFGSIIRPSIYCHVNLLSIEDAITFFTTICATINALAPCVLTLQISFDLFDLDTTPTTQQFWDCFQRSLGRMTSLLCFTLCYSHDDPLALSCISNFAHIFSPSLVKLHLAPLLDELFLVCLLSIHLTHLIFT
jgi:hypothetical protein